jgi:hypothetical protein
MFQTLSQRCAAAGLMKCRDTFPFFRLSDERNGAPGGARALASGALLADQ